MTPGTPRVMMTGKGDGRMEPIHYVVRQVNGDYGMLRDQNGSEIMVAMALLPPGCDEGSRVVWENFEYALED